MATITPVITKLGSHNVTVTWSSFGLSDTCEPFDASEYALASWQTVGDAEFSPFALKATNEDTFNPATAPILDSWNGVLLKGPPATNSGGAMLPVQRVRWIAPVVTSGSGSVPSVILFFRGD
jgi:hypothetical protein